MDEHARLEAALRAMSASDPFSAVELQLLLVILREGGAVALSGGEILVPTEALRQALGAAGHPAHYLDTEQALGRLTRLRLSRPLSDGKRTSYAILSEVYAGENRHSFLVMQLNPRFVLELSRVLRSL